MDHISEDDAEGCWDAAAFMPLSKVPAGLLICSRWHFNSSLQLIFNSSQNIVSANISNSAAPSPARRWPVRACEGFHSLFASSWGDRSAAVCKWCGANGCCSTRSGICEAKALISPKALRGVWPLPAINGPACEAGRSLLLVSPCFCVITCIIATDGMASLVALWWCGSPNINNHSVRIKGAAVSHAVLGFSCKLWEAEGFRSMLSHVFARCSLGSSQSAKQNLSDCCRLRWVFSLTSLH